MAFSWPVFLSFYTQDIACRHSLGELSLKKKNLNALHIFSLLGFLLFYSFSYILVSFCFLIHLLEIDCQCWLALQHHGPVPRALRLVKGKAIETGIILSILDKKKILMFFENRSLIKKQLPLHFTPPGSCSNLWKGSVN